MKFDDKTISKILLDGAYVTKEDVSAATLVAKKQSISLVDALQLQGVLTHELLGQAVGESLKLPYANLTSISPSREMVHHLKKTTAETYRAVVFAIDTETDTVKVASDSPKKKGIATAIKKAVPHTKKVAVYYTLPADIESAFIHYRKMLSTSFADILESDRKFAPEIISKIVEDAVVYRASDIHFEPQDTETVIRFRIDGVLQEAGRLPKEYYQNIVNRLKVQAHLRIDEHNRAQDGAIRMLIGDDKKVDLRISMIPTLDGEKIVIRVLAEYVREFTLGELGLDAEASSKVELAVRQPFGMILVVGPTGSGKTTTLYTVLRMLNTPEVNLTTIEDPVEYKVPGINQIQVNNATNLSFADGLRSIVRQDPDVILVGEIRDTETAEIAVNAALTGHLMLSTFHANDAATAVPRLIEMGVEPFLLASTLEIIVAQRLVRRICTNCRVSHSMTAKQMKDTYPKIPKTYQKKTTMYTAKGCDSCNGTGYRGRMALYEYIDVTPELEALILDEPSSKDIWELALKQGARSMFADGMEKVTQGVTSLEEVIRVAPPR